MWKISLLLALCLITVCNSATFIVPASPGQPTVCSYDGEELKPGETIYPMGKCHSLTCADDYTLGIATCGVVAAGNGCHLVKPDLTKKYPKCCATVKCNKN